MISKTAVETCERHMLLTISCSFAHGYLCSHFIYTYLLYTFKVQLTSMTKMHLFLILSPKLTGVFLNNMIIFGTSNLALKPMPKVSVSKMLCKCIHTQTRLVSIKMQISMFRVGRLQNFQYHEYASLHQYACRSGFSRHNGCLFSTHIYNYSFQWQSKLMFFNPFVTLFKTYFWSYFYLLKKGIHELLDHKTVRGIYICIRNINLYRNMFVLGRFICPVFHSLIC